MYVYFDVDDTLVIYSYDFKELGIAPEDPEVFILDYPTLLKDNPYDLKDSFVLYPHKEHIKALKAHFNSGSTVVVWSQGGTEWARAVVYALGLTKYVHYILAKPDKYYDALPANGWMPLQRTYIPIKK